MFGLGSTLLGVSLTITGVIFFVFTLFLVRAVPKIRPRPIPRQPKTKSALPEHQEAILLVQRGGKVVYTNLRAREQFQLWDASSHLEQLARRSRPSHVFWDLCATEGRAVFSIDGHPFEGVSYFIPDEAGDLILVALRRVDPQEEGLPTELDTQLKRVLDTLNQSLAGELELETTLNAILQSVDHLIPTDFSEITIWDPGNQWLVPYRYLGIQGVDRRMHPTSDRYQLDQGYSGYLATHREPLLITDVSARQDLSPAVDRVKYPLQSYLGVPLLVGDELVGTLELSSRDKEAFTEHDLHTLQMLASQVAIVLHTSLIFQAEQQRAQELASLANLANAINSVSDYEELFGHLIEGISPLLDIEIAGFLIFNEGNKTLEAKNPFLGVPPQFVELYQVEIPPDSPAEEVWLQQETIISQDPSSDPRIIALGLDHMARAAGIHEIALIPLTSSGRLLGYLQASNKRDGTSINERDVRLLTIIAGQAAPIIDNAYLIKQSISRALRAEALRRIASLSGSNATLDEIFKYSLLELARLLQADFGGIFLVDESLGELQVHVDSLFGVQLADVDFTDRLTVRDDVFRNTVTYRKRPFLTANAELEERILPIFTPLVRKLGVQSVLDVPLISRSRGLGEIILASQKAGQFSQSDIQLASTVAGQIAIAIERSRLASQTDAHLQTQIEQLTTLTRVGRELNTVLEIPLLLKMVYEAAMQSTHADCGAVLLTTQETNGEGSPEITHAKGERARAGLHPLEEVVLTQGTSLLIEDFSHPPEGIEPGICQPPHEGIHSALLVPIAFQEDVVGVIHLHAEKPAFFSPDALQFTQALAIQAALAISNAQRHEKQSKEKQIFQKRLRALRYTLKTAQEIRLDQPLEVALETLARGIAGATGFQSVAISVYRAEDGQLTPIAFSGIPEEVQEEAKGSPCAWSEIQTLIQGARPSGAAWVLPQEELAQLGIRLPTNLQPKKDPPSQEPGVDGWQPGGEMFIPLQTGSGEPLGLIQLGNPADQHPSTLEEEPDTLAFFALQATWLLEHEHQCHNLKSNIRGLSEQIEDLTAIQEKLPDLVSREAEQARMIKDLTLATLRVEAGLEIVQLLNAQPERAAILETLGREMVNRLGFDLALIAAPFPGGPRLSHILGEVPEEVNPETYLGQRNPLLPCLQEGVSFLVQRVSESEQWKASPLLTALEAKSFVCLPVASARGVEAGVLAIAQQEIPSFTGQDEYLFELLSNQAAAAINNLDLLTETSHRFKEVNLLLDFSRQLTVLEPSRIIRSLIESSREVAYNTQAGMVALLDSGGNALTPQEAIGYANPEALLNISFSLEATLPGQVFSSGEAWIVDEVDFAAQYTLNSDDLLCYQEGTGGVLPVSSLVVPIQSRENKLGVLILDNFKEAGAFSDEDKALIASLTQQTALALENARLFQAAEERAAQLQALSTAASQITVSLEPEELIESLLDSLADILPFDTGTLWLREGDKLTIRATRGFENQEDLIGISTTTKDSRLFSQMITTHEPVYAGDVRGDPRFPLASQERLSWLGLPLVAKGEMAGVLAVEKKEAGFYTDELIQIATTFASQAAIALENARLFKQSHQRALELDDRSQRLALLNRFSNRINSALDLNFILHTTLAELKQTLPGTGISIVMWKEGDPILWAESEAWESEPGQRLPEAPIFDRLRQTLGVFNTQHVDQETELEPLMAFFQERDTQALLILPLATGEELHGLFLVQKDHAYRFNPDEIELGLIISNQAASAVQNALLYAETTRLTEELEHRVAMRTEQLEREHHRTQSLLQIMRELSSSLDVDQMLSRTLVILNETVGAEQSTILMARPEEEVFFYRASLGYTEPPPRGGRQTHLAKDEGLAGWVVENQQSVLIDNLTKDQRWVTKTDDPEMEHRSAIAVPMVVGAEALGAILLFHRQIAHFTPEDQDLVQAAATQMAIAINNSELFNLIRDQAESLGNMLRNQQVEASRSRAILEAVADGVLVTDPQNTITLFNESAQEILGLDRTEVIGKSLEAFTGLFGNATHSWMETIRNWSEEQGPYQPGETFAEQITLEDQTVVAVHLAPVVMGNEYLGSVSIFRDITHQVEVDRLKSEFVATVSHELRTPMTSIKGYVEVLLMGAAGELTEQQIEFLEIVKSNTERLNILVNDLLDVSRIEAGRVELFFQPLDMRHLLEEALQHQAGRAEEDGKPMSFQLQVPDRLPRVPGDEERVRQILDNLLSNAYHYTPPNGQIILRASLLEDELLVEVEDTGIGIPPEVHERIFERFYRGENPLILATSGTGLGLPIVQQLVEMHHGRLWFQSSGVLGEGSTFSFTLPLQQPDDPNHP